MKTISFKNKIILILSFVTCIAILAGGALFGVNTAKADATGFETVKNVQIRKHIEKERLGIRYQLRMESEKYNTFMATYTGVEFGAFIIPEDYRTSKGEFTELNLFGGVVEGEPFAPIYYWGDVADEDETGKTQIINLSTNAMTKIETVDGVSYNTVYAAITNVKTKNATRAFAGVGYVKYTDGDTVKYIISDNGSDYSYSIAQVAQNALDNSEVLELEDKEIAAIEQITAIKPAVKLSANCCETLLKEDVEKLVSMGEELDITALAKSYAPMGLKLDEDNSVLTATVPFVGYAEFDVKYVEDSQFSFDNLNGKNLLDYYSLFDEEYGVMTKYTDCEHNHSACWCQHLDISSTTAQELGHGGKYINISREGCDIGCYFDSEFVNQMVAAGYKTLKIVTKSTFDGAICAIYDVDIDANGKVPSGGWSEKSTTDPVAGENDFSTFTYDITKFDRNMMLFLTSNDGVKSGKIYLYEISFSKPVEEPTPEIDYDGLNLLTLENLFDDEIMYELECNGDRATHTKCWVNHIDISETAAERWGRTGKYIYMSRTGKCDVGIYFNSDLYKQLREEGFTTLTVVGEKTKDDMNIKFYNYNPDTNSWTPNITGAPATDDNGLTTWTFDLTTINITDVPMIGMTGGEDGAIHIIDISFSK